MFSLWRGYEGCIPSFGCYKFVGDVWAHVLSLWNLRWVFPSSIGDLWSQWSGLFSNLALDFLLSLTLPYFAWRFWLERNKIYFRDVALSLIRLSFKNCATIKENFLFEVSFQVGPNIFVAPCDALVSLNGTSIVIYLFLWRRERLLWMMLCGKILLLVGWKSILMELWKGNLRLASCGGVLHDSNGRFSSMVVLPLGT